jgi:sulfate adenylyltransferase subunit 2
MTDSIPTPAPQGAPGSAPASLVDGARAWDLAQACEELQRLGLADSRRTAERRLHGWGLLPSELELDALRDELGRPPRLLVLRAVLERVRAQRRLALFVQLHRLPDGRCTLHANDARGARSWVGMGTGAGTGAGMGAPDAAAALRALEQLRALAGKPVGVFAHGELVGLLRGQALPAEIGFVDEGYAPVAPLLPWAERRASAALGSRSEHLQRLEAESIHILREALSQADNPVMLYSVGKDSAVMLHLARKAFYPGRPPFPLLHVDTRWKFQQMYLFRDAVARASGMPLLVHVNPEAVARDINPFDHGSALHTDITKTQGLKQALDANGFDVVFGGARRDEEKSRAKERIFSFRDAHHAWDPKNQRPELWNLYNTRKRKGESIRVFPLSNWTELDVWQYIHQEAIPVVPLYFAKPRPVVRREGLLLMVDDDRFRLLASERIEFREVRFRTLGCYPLSGAVESRARSVPEIIDELLDTRQSERQGRAIDADGAASMERKKKEGYF